MQKDYLFRGPSEYIEGIYCYLKNIMVVLMYFMDMKQSIKRAELYINYFTAGVYGDQK